MKCVFSEVTNRGTGCNRDALPGEYMLDLDITDIGWFMSYPERYKMENGQLVEVEQAILDAEDTAVLRKQLQDANRKACQEHILKKYPLEKQSTAALGVYPVEFVGAMKDFIARCIEEENRIYDLLESLDPKVVEKPIWPEV